MKGLIRRQAAINAIDVKNVSKGIISALQSIIEELPSAEQWIPVTERLPVWEGWYIVTIDVGNSSYINYKVNTLYMKDGKWHDYACGGLDEFNMPVIAWMELPEPYEGGDAK